MKDDWIILDFSPILKKIKNPSCEGPNASKIENVGGGF